MSLIKELKSNPENQVNLVDVIQLLCPVEKTKYVDLLLRLVKKTNNIENYSHDVKQYFRQIYGVDEKKFIGFTPFQMFIIQRIVSASFNEEDLKSFFKFIEYNERGLIDDNDITRITNFDNILHLTSLAEIKSIEKDLTKQIKMIHSDEEWVVLRPLTYLSSLKYGASTKWCTSSEKNPEYFLDYVKRGILIYMINKISGRKVACFKSLDGDAELSFWNQIDKRIDSMETDLPDFIIKLIKTEINNEMVTNFSLLEDEVKVKQDRLLNQGQYKSSSILAMGVAEPQEAMNNHEQTLDPW
jgi:hypothetical protein